MVPHVAQSLPPEFTDLHTVDDTINLDMRYATPNNFLGRPVYGYLSQRCIVTKVLAATLKQIQQQLKKSGLGLKIFDAYRPQRAVNDFITWSEDESDQKMKQAYYPRVNKKDLFALNYLAKKSSHSRGSTVDVTLISLEKNAAGELIELDMGTSFDFMDELSHPLNKAVGSTVFENRMTLRQFMVNAGFKPVASEWWHFTLIDEPYPDTYFDFVIF